MFIRLSLGGCRRYFGTAIEYTKDLYKLVRGPFARLEARHYDFFESLLGASRVLRQADDCEPFNVDWTRTLRGCSRCVLQPRTTAEVSAILRFCSAHQLAVCPQGGNTGLVGGGVPVFDEIVLSTSRMTAVLDVDAVSGAVVCQAGCVLADLDRVLEAHALQLPLDLAARGSCQIGGNVATNAGGVRVLRYGGLHANLLGLEAVLPAGDVVDCLSTPLARASPLKHLFVGAEGTLGVVTSVALRCPPRPTATCAAYLGMPTMAHVIATFRDARRHLATSLAAFELMDAVAVDLVQRHLRVRAPVGGAHALHVLVEVASSGSSDVEQQQLQQQMEAFVADALHAGHVADGVVSGEPGKVRRMWEVRELITSALPLQGAHVLKFDVSVPLERFYDLVAELRRTLAADDVTVCGYGHVGDGNLHLNVAAAEEDGDALRRRVEPLVYERVRTWGGSVSAEHGVGVRKAAWLHHVKPPPAMATMRALKRAMDPRGILNPYKVLVA